MDFTVQVDDDRAESLNGAAKGVPVEAFARDALAHHLFAEIELSRDPDPTIDRQVFDHVPRRGEMIPWQTLKPWVQSWER